MRPSLIPGRGRSTGEGIGYPLLYSWASLVAQLVRNLPAMQETWLPCLGCEAPLEKEKATHSSIPAWRNSMDSIVHGITKNQITRLSNFHFHFSAWSREKGEEDNPRSGLRMLGSSGDQLRCSGSLSRKTEVQSCKYGSITPRAVHDLFSFLLF